MTDPTFHVDWDEEHGRGDESQRWRIYRLCSCSACLGSGKDEKGRCIACRGEGRERELVATCANPEAVGVTLCTLGAEGEFDDCPVGILDTMGEVGHKWVLRPWSASAREITQAHAFSRRRRVRRGPRLTDLYLAGVGYITFDSGS